MFRIVQAVHMATAASAAQLAPALYLSHGGGPCFMMDAGEGPLRAMDRTSQAAADYRALAFPSSGAGTTNSSKALPRPSAMVVISAHWEEATVSIQTSSNPAMLFDYGGFPAHTYELKWPAPGNPALAARVKSMLTAAGIQTREDQRRGFDHGTFVPLLLLCPDADVPTIQVSMHASLNPALHLRMGQALAPLRAEGVMIVGSGSSTHNFGQMLGQQDASGSARFSKWLEETLTHVGPEERVQRLLNIEKAPGFRDAHPREDHLAPLYAVIGAVSPHVPIPATRFSGATGSSSAEDCTSTASAAAVAPTGAVELDTTVAAAGKGKVIWGVKLRDKLTLESYGFGL